jgi:hypothetical protein
MANKIVKYKGRPGVVNTLVLSYRDLVLADNSPISISDKINVYSYTLDGHSTLVKTFTLTSKKTGSFEPFSITLEDSPCIGVEMFSSSGEQIFGYITLKSE